MDHFLYSFPHSFYRNSIYVLLVVRINYFPKDNDFSWFLDIVQFTSVTQSCLTLCNSMDCSTPGLPVLHQPLSIESVMPSNHLILCCPLILLPSIFPSIRIFSNEFSSSHQVAKILELDTRIQNILLATIAYSSVGTLLCPHARWHHL